MEEAHDGRDDRGKFPLIEGHYRLHFQLDIVEGMVEENHIRESQRNGECILDYVVYKLGRLQRREM